MDTVINLFKSHCHTENFSVTPLPLSGSNRRYYRIEWDNASLIAVKGEIREENEAFIYMSGYFGERGVNVPKVYASDGLCYLQEDLGNVSLFDLIMHDDCFPHHSDTVVTLIEQTLRQLAFMQFVAADRTFDYCKCYPEPTFDVQSIWADLYYFKYCYLRPSGIAVNEKYLHADFCRLVDDLCTIPFDAFMYRDFQSRNVMIKEGKPYFIDYQGGRKGPCLYDPISFIWQAKAQFTDALKQRMMTVYKEAVAEYCSYSDNLDHLIGTYAYFRSLQVLGAYGYRGNFERKRHFLDSIPYAIENVLQLTARYSIRYTYLNELFRLLTDQLNRDGK